MSINITFLIKLDKDEYHTIVAQLKSAQFEVNSLTYMDQHTPISSYYSGISSDFIFSDMLSTLIIVAITTC